MKRCLLLMALAMSGLSLPGVAPAQTAGGYPFELKAINRANGQEITLGMNSAKEAEDHKVWLENYEEPPYVKGFANVRWEPNRNYGRNPLISDRPINPEAAGRSPGPWILISPRFIQSTPTPSPSPSPTPTVLPAQRPVSVPTNPVIQKQLDQLRDTLLPESKPNSQLQPGKTNRFGYDDTLAKTAPKGVLMRVGIDKTTLQSAAAAPKLLERIRKDK